MKARSRFFGLVLNDDDGLLLEIRAGRQRPFQVIWSHAISAANPLPGSRLRQLASIGSRTALLMPDESVSILQTSLPPLKAAETERALHGTIAREENDPQTEWALDWYPLPPRGGRRGPEGKRDIATVYTRRDVLTGEVARGSALGVTPTVMAPGFIALDALYRKHLAQAGDESEAWSLVFLGERERFICVADADGVLFTRSLPEDLSDGSESEEYLDQLATQVERSNFFARQAERSLIVDRVVICGDPALTETLVARVNRQDDQRAEIWQPLEMFEQVDPDWSGDSILALANAATALRPGLFNLAPEKPRSRLIRELRKRVLVTAAVLAGLIVPLLLVGEFWTLAAQKTVLLDSQRQLSLIEGRAESAAVAYLRDRALFSRRENIRNFGLDRPDLGGLLRDMADDTPRQVVYEDITLTRHTPGDYDLLLEGEALGPDGERAQRIFMGFLDSLSGCRRLREIAAPRSLAIDGDSRDKEDRSRVEFALEFRVKEDSGR